MMSQNQMLGTQDGHDQINSINDDTEFNNTERVYNAPILKKEGIQTHDSLTEKQYPSGNRMVNSMND